jgi:hypothetical protein
LVSSGKNFLLAKQAFRGKYDEATSKMAQGFYQRFFSQQFKPPSCMPDGPKVGSINLSPRGDWRMPSDASAKMCWTSRKVVTEKLFLRLQLRAFINLTRRNFIILIYFKENSFSLFLFLASFTTNVNLKSKKRYSAHNGLT